MDHLMKYIIKTSRCFTIYRGSRLPVESLEPHRHVYILRICQNPGLSQEKLSKILFINKSNVARQLNVLERDGFIIRKPAENDRRQLLVYPTENAKKIYPKIIEANREWDEDLLSDISSEDRKKLITMLETITEKAEKKIQETEY